MYNVEYDLQTYGVRPEEGEDLTNGKYMVFDIEGDSMYPTIQSGFKILCEKICEGNWEYAKGVVVIVYGKTLTVKRIHKNDLYINNRITLKADNPTYGEIEIAEKYDYTLPVISNQKYNDYLGTLIERIGIDKNVTTHTARHTFGTYLINKGVRESESKKAQVRGNMIKGVKGRRDLRIYNMGKSPVKNIFVTFLEDSNE